MIYINFVYEMPMLDFRMRDGTWNSSEPYVVGNVNLDSEN